MLYVTYQRNGISSAGDCDYHHAGTYNVFFFILKCFIDFCLYLK